MSDLFVKHIALAIPEADRQKALKFYEAFGLDCKNPDDKLVDVYCEGLPYPSIRLLVNAPKKVLHHVEMGASAEVMAHIQQNIATHNLASSTAPDGFEVDGIWVKDPNGALYHIVEAVDAYEEVAVTPFLINSPGNRNRLNKGALPPKSTLPKIRPRKLGHVLLFTPDTNVSLDFVQNILGMRLSDRSGEGIVFTHCVGGSEHHVLAFAKSSHIGFHHASFLVASPDEVGIGGDRMYQQGYTKAWGFGRHAVGSNFFHYIADPWGSYVEYYSDMDYIHDSDSWEAQDWPPEDALHSWGPNPPEDFVHNYEADAVAG